MKAIILARVSSKDQEEGQSIPAQVNRLTEYAHKRGLEVAHIFQITESSSRDTRKQFDQILALIKKSKESIILITDTIDRLQRSFRETPILDELRRSGKLELRFLRENLILNRDSNSSDLTRWDMGVVFAASYVRQLSDNVKRSQAQCLRTGVWTAKAPFGYKNITLPEGKKKAIIVDPETAPYVIKMFEMYASGNHSLATITEEMNKSGMRNGKGRDILPSRVEVTLKNSFYHGIMYVKGEAYKHKYPPLITEELFRRVQKMMSGHGKAPAHFAGKPILLRGMITCKQCSCMITGDIKKGKYIYYACSNSRRICKKIWVREEDLLTEMLSNFDRITLSDTDIESIVTQLRDAYNGQNDFAQAAQQKLQKELTLLRSRRSRLVDMRLDESIDTETYQAKESEYKNREREITAELETLLEADDTHIITAQTVLSLAQRARKIFESSNMDEKQQLLRFVYSNFILDAKKLDLELREPFLSMAKTPCHPGWLGREDSNLRSRDQNPLPYHLATPQ
jgi:site-specific DNA recombinase